MEEKIEILIRRQPATLMCDVFLYSDCRSLSKGDVIAFYNFDDKGNIVVTHKVYDHGVSHMEDIKPTMTLPEYLLRSFIAGFANKAKQEGIKNNDDSFVKGKLEAVSEHLKDMRALVFKPEQKD